jgi:gliding motility-associated-like protein
MISSRTFSKVNFGLLTLAAALTILFTNNVLAQCLNAPNGQWPGTTFTPACGASCTYQTITTAGYNGEYSRVNVIAGNTYRFRSSVTTDFITISNTGGTVSFASGLGGAPGITWVATITGTVRFYTHTSAACGSNTTNRTRSVCCIGGAPAAPANDLVCNATTITCGSSTAGTTVNATSTGTYEGTTFCGTGQSSAGVWYRFVGTGQTITASLCATAWDSKIQVYSGATCTALTCIGGVDDAGPACAGLSASYSWVSTLGTTYWINVSGYSTTSAFNLALTCLTPAVAPPNDLVCSATSISCGATLAGTTINATNSGTGENGFCGTSQTMPGVWYVVPGNGQIMTASLCGTAWDSKISVFSGPNCSTLTCVGGVDDNGPACVGASASFTWTSVVGQNYYILVHGFSTNSAFSLALSCLAPPTADLSSITASATTICNGQNTMLTANGAVGTVYWFTGGCATTGQIGTGNTLTVSPTLTTTYYARNFDAGQWSTNCASITITVNPNPVVNAGPDQTQCPGNINLTGTIVPMTANVFSENFGGTINWTTNDPVRWGVNATANAGGASPEVMFQWSSGGVGTFLDASAFSPVITATGYNGLTMSFIQNVDHFTGTYALSAEVSLDNITWTPVWTINPTASIGASAVSGINLGVVDNQIFYLRFRFNGDVWNINNWYIDNIVISGAAAPPASWSSTPAGFTSTSLTPSFTVPTTTTFTLSSTLNGCTATDNVLITIQDLINPTITAPGAVSVVADAGSCVATGVALGTPTTADNCSVASTTNNAPVSFPLGNTTVTWTVTDGSGNSATATQIVTVTDNQNPTISAPAAVTVNADAGTCNATGVALGTPTTADNCSVASVVSNAPASFPLGATTVTWTVTDGSGNTATATQTVTVIDNQNPTITAPGNVNVFADAGTCTATGVALGAPTTADNCSVASTVNDAPAAFPLGATTVTWTVTDGSGNTATATQTVTVIDNQNPTISAPANVNVFADAGACTATGVALGTPTTADNCSVASTINNGLVTFPLGTTTVTWTVTDGSGNTATATQTVTVSDNQNPTITAPANVSVNTDPGLCSASAVALGTPITADNCSVASLVSNALVSYPTGTTTVTWTVTDGSGNTATSTQTVTVTDNENPSALCQGVTIQLDATGNTSVTAAQVDNGSTDNCGIATMTLSQSTFTCANVGANPIVMTVTDVNGNSSTCLSVITVQDLIAPTVVCQNITVLLDALGVATITPAQINNGSTDNCAIANLSLSQTTFGCFDSGANNVTLTVTDVNGNSATCVAVVTVQDNVAPGFSTVPSNITQTAVDGLCGRVITYAIPTFFDACGAVLSQTDGSGLTSGAIFPVGVTTQTYSLTDASGNSISASFTITITDDELPVITNCPANVTSTASATGCGTVVTWVEPVASDNCPAVAVVSTHAPGSFFPTGATTVTYTATDAAGNTSTCSFTVTVNDNLPPIAPTLATATDACSITVTAPTANDNCSGTVTGTTTAPLTYNAQGTYTITWTFTDGNGNSSTATQSVVVLDTSAPTIVAPSTVNATANAACNATGIVLGTPTTADNCSVTSVTNNAPATFPLGTTLVIWTVSDAAGNSSTAAQSVTITDNTVPTISAPGALTVQANVSCASFNVNLGTPITADNCGVASVSNNSPAVFPLGATTVTWTVTDNSGNTATATQTVTVVDQGAPSLIAPANITIPAGATCSVTPTNIGNAFTADNCTAGTVTNDAPTTFPIGTTTVTWTVTDGAGNTSTATQTVTVIDLVAPSITAPATVAATTTSGCSATGVVLGTPTTSDNCSSVTVSNNAPSIYPVGSTTVTWTATDASGNSTMAVQTVTVTDVIAPIVTAPANVTVSSTSGCTAQNVNLGSPEFTDNCSVASVTNNAPTTFPSGATSVTWTVTDASGNTATATQTVTVVDQVNPTISAPANVITTTNTGCTSTSVALGTPTSTDNCSAVTVSNNAPSSFPIGTTSVTWTATDASGNTATATQTVTITDAIIPTITAPANVTAQANNSCAAFNVVLGTPTTADNCTVASVTNNAPAIFPLGTTTVTWTVTDASGNSATATQTVTVSDTQAPTIVAPASINVNTTANCVASGLVLGNPFASDNCSLSSVVNDAPLDFPVGMTSITWTATDASGNTATATQTVTVTDIINPTAQLQDITIVLNNTGAASITFADVDLGSSDNCGLASTILSQSDFDCGDIGENTITVTLIDVNGNSTITTIKVTVETNGIDSDNDGIDDSCDGTTDPIEADIPEAFTPNGNNINDLFVVGNIEFYNERSIDVFNRYGNQVYSSKAYNNDWDGTRSDNGQALPDGTYYYVLTLNGEIKKGFVYINRVKQ